jgi:hypothetical protein
MLLGAFEPGFLGGGDEGPPGWDRPQKSQANPAGVHGPPGDDPWGFQEHPSYPWPNSNRVFLTPRMAFSPVPSAFMFLALAEPPEN